MLQFKRGKGKNNADYVMLDIYKAYMFMHPKSTIDFSTYLEICSTFNRFCMMEIVCRGTEINLPVIGSVSIRKYKSQPHFGKEGKLLLGGVPVDWKATKEFWERDPKAREEKKLIRNLNEHTDGYRYRFFWDKGVVKVRNIISYSFIPMRKYSRMLKDVLNDENTSVDFYVDTTKFRMTEHANG